MEAAGSTGGAAEGHAGAEDDDACEITLSGDMEVLSERQRASIEASKLCLCSMIGLSHREAMQHAC
jgi:hypothetical protein